MCQIVTLTLSFQMINSLTFMPPLPPTVWLSVTCFMCKPAKVFLISGISFTEMIILPLIERAKSAIWSCWSKWYEPIFLDTLLVHKVVLLKLQGRQVTVISMASCWIVKQLNIIKHIIIVITYLGLILSKLEPLGAYCLCRFSRWVHSTPNTFFFKQAKKAFGAGVIVTITTSTHAGF